MDQGLQILDLTTFYLNLVFYLTFNGKPLLPAPIQCLWNWGFPPFEPSISQVPTHSTFETKLEMNTTVSASSFITYYENFQAYSHMLCKE